MLIVVAIAKVGSVPSHVIGACGVADENSAGELFRQRLESTAIFACGTYHEIGPTWTGSRGRTHRLDYVCLSEALHCSVVGAAAL
eukprot:151716-Lingulodinium_polyedra.AAC.1